MRVCEQARGCTARAQGSGPAFLMTGRLSYSVSSKSNVMASISILPFVRTCAQLYTLARHPRKHCAGLLGGLECTRYTPPSTRITFRSLPTCIPALSEDACMNVLQGRVGTRPCSTHRTWNQRAYPVITWLHWRGCAHATKNQQPAVARPGGRTAGVPRTHGPAGRSCLKRGFAGVQRESAVARGVRKVGGPCVRGAASGSHTARSRLTNEWTRRAELATSITESSLPPAWPPRLIYAPLWLHYAS